MENDNVRLLETLENISLGKRLTVASHSVKASPKRSLMV